MTQPLFVSGECVIVDERKGTVRGVPLRRGDTYVYAIEDARFEVFMADEKDVREEVTSDR